MVLETSLLPAVGLFFVIVVLIFVFAERYATGIYRHNPLFAIIRQYISEQAYVKIWRFGKYFMLIGYIVVVAYLALA